LHPIQDKTGKLTKNVVGFRPFPDSKTKDGKKPQKSVNKGALKTKSG
jgi:hypothetical protein